VRPWRFSCLGEIEVGSVLFLSKSSLLYSADVGVLAPSMPDISLGHVILGRGLVTFDAHLWMPW
jgi:hypothetical protein